MIIGSRQHSKQLQLMLVRSAALLLILIVILAPRAGAAANFGECPQDSNLSQSQRSSLQEIVAAGRENRGSRKAKGVGVLFTCSEKEKAAAAKILTNELRGDLYRVDLSKIVGKYIGETEKNLRQVFATARARQSILFFDEAESLFGKRTEVKDSHDRYANMAANYLLQQIEEYHGIAILSVVRKQNIDPAFTRRLRFVVEFC